ncbi:MAG: sodium:solute symporter, partial [Bacteroidetes bacterium]|nr:sodium:solute symporter [Bacteroidota bacterium]
DARSFLLSNNDMRWYTVCLSIMATQASAITFLSTPGQAFVDGMGFVQFYFGLPIAMVILSITAVPNYFRLKVFTAYEFLESRFDVKTRSLAAFLFLIQRGLGAGLTIYAPSLILSVILGWDIVWTNLIIGSLVVLYTTTGGSRAVSWTQSHQMLVIFLGMTAAAVTVLLRLPPDISFRDTLHLAAQMNKLNLVDFSLDPDNRYTIWSGLLGGLFLQLSYFGTDQSQVGRYLTAQSITQSRLGLLCNGLVKIPMQFLILFLGVLVFVFYLFVTPPLHFNPINVDAVRQGSSAAAYADLESEYEMVHRQRQQTLRRVLSSESGAVAVLENQNSQMQAIREDAQQLISEADPGASVIDTNFIFLTFVLNFLPVGLVGLVIAAILAASMSSTSSELNALASTTVVDVYKRLIRRQRPGTEGTGKHELLVSRVATFLWGVVAIGFAEFAGALGSLIEAVNILGSLFYGTILGIFLAAFYVRKIGGTSVFAGALLAEAIVIWCYNYTSISFLWYNVIGCVGVILLSLVIDPIIKKTATSKKDAAA